jgi:hypothetical protein
MLGLPLEQKVCLMFGTISPYKGIKEVVKFWTAANMPHRLIVAGPAISTEYAELLGNLARDNPSVDLRFRAGWLDDEIVRIWLSAADCAIFNYSEIFTSGAAALARSFGLPVLVPRRATTLDLGEPHPHVLRFDSIDTDFCEALAAALATPRDYDLARDWRNETAWARVAETTASVYRHLRQKNRFFDRRVRPPSPKNKVAAR